MRPQGAPAVVAAVCTLTLGGADPFFTAQAHPVADPARADLMARSAYLVVDPGSHFTRALARFFWRRFVARSGTVAGQLFYALGERNFAGDRAHALASAPVRRALYVGDSVLHR
jgi:hypothetical protein